MFRLLFWSLFSLPAFLYVDTTQAASLYLEPSQNSINRGDTVTISVRLDTDEEECVNVIDGVLEYSPNLEPVDTSRGSSILSVWVEDPVINKDDRTITFAGGIPNGYCGRIAGDPRLSNVVLELLFRSPGMVIGAVANNDVAEVKFAQDTRVLLNDGFGTEAPLALYDTQINLSKQVGNLINNEWNNRVDADQISPEEFTISLEKGGSAFSNKYFIVFNTTDKQSGIDHYEVIEEPLREVRLFKWGAVDAPWITTRSPYVLKDQSLNSVIRVKAVDKAGNEYIAVLIPDESKRQMTLQSKILVALIGTILLSSMGAAIWWWYRRHYRSRLDEDLSNEEHEV